jgi:hypothetical protein
MVTRESLRLGTAARVVALAGVVSLTGCIGMKSGGGPLPTERAMQAYGRQMGTVSAAEKERFERIEAKLKAKPGRPLPCLRFALAGAPRLESQMAAKGGFAAILSCGFWNAKARYADRISVASDSVTLYTRENICIPGYPFVWPLWMAGSETYLADSGKQVGDVSFCGLGLGGVLGGHSKAIAPAYDKQSAVTQIREAKQFNVVKMNWLAAGILGCGRANDTYYGQILWIAFPLGHAE